VDDGSMSLSEHLEELRTRLFRALAAVVGASVLGWHYKQRLFAWVLRPFEVAWYCRSQNGCEISQFSHFMTHPGHFWMTRQAAARALAARPPAGPTPMSVYADLHFPDPTAGFVAYLKIAVVGGFALALPVVFWQLWSFIAPGLYPREKRLILPFVGSSTGFFLGGAAFGYYMVFPVGHEFLMGFSGVVEGTGVRVVPTIMMEEYLSFTLQMLFAFGVLFDLPLFVFFLALAGLVDWRQLLNFGRYFTVIAFILAAILTPGTDVFSQVALGLPLVALYYLAVVLAFFFGPKKGRWKNPLLPPEKTRNKPLKAP
jgi:sec-independent protein translocase protein TatC